MEDPKKELSEPKPEVEGTPVEKDISDPKPEDDDEEVTISWRSIYFTSDVQEIE